MVAKAIATTLVGVDAFRVDIEAQIRSGLKKFSVVGLPDGILREAKERVRCAIENSGFSFPNHEVVVSLAPASLPKRGSGLDLPIALSILAADGQLNPESLRDKICIGELALDGMLKPVIGELAAACYVNSHPRYKLLMPVSHSQQAAAIGEVRVFGFESLAHTVAFLNGRIQREPSVPELSNVLPRDFVPGYGDVRGQSAAKRAIEIAAAGAHNIFLVGPPGAGKSMLARRLPSILPPLSSSEAIEVAKIYNVSQPINGALPLTCIPRFRPFRSPHHSTSTAGLIGGGSSPIPGEITLAHRGILFLDEFPEIRRDSLECLREPLETKSVTISRAKERVQFPADFMLVGAMNPCPCGKYGTPATADMHSGPPEVTRAISCECLTSDRRRYLSRVSGPIIDRIDLQVWVPPVPISELSGTLEADPTLEMAARVNQARAIQQQRYQDQTHLNSQMSTSQISKWCRLSGTGQGVVEAAAKRYGLSARGYSRILRVSRTIADLDGEDDIQPGHLAEALSYRQQFSRLL